MAIMTTLNTEQNIIGSLVKALQVAKVGHCLSQEQVSVIVVVVLCLTLAIVTQPGPYESPWHKSRDERHLRSWCSLSLRQTARWSQLTRALLLTGLVWEEQSDQPS